MFGESSIFERTSFRCTPQIGRTHGIHAEPITFGLKIAIGSQKINGNIARFATPPRKWLSANFRRRRQRFALGRKMEERICKRLGLSVAPVASQSFSATATRSFSAPRAHRRHPGKNRA